jgi:hypothetical protein
MGVEMFRAAYAEARQFTFPVIDFFLTVDGKCGAGATAFVVVNQDGWIVTAAHVIKQSFAMAKSRDEVADWEKNRAQIQDDQTISAKDRSKRIAALGKLNKKAVSKTATFWGFSGVKRLVDISMLEYHATETRSDMGINVVTIRGIGTRRCQHVVVGVSQLISGDYREHALLSRAHFDRKRGTREAI